MTAGQIGSHHARSHQGHVPHPPGVTAAEASGLVETIRRSWARVEPHTEALTRLFYGLLFERMPASRALFPINMEVQRSRLLRALVHVVQMVDKPDELDPFLDQLGRDHRKFEVVDEHYDALGLALVGAVEQFSGSSWTPHVAAAWTQAYAIVADRMRAAANGERGPASWTGRVVEHRRLGWDLAITTVQTDGTIPYRAGQYLSVETPHRPRLWRYLSPANPPRDDGLIEFHIRAVDGGWVSRAVVAHSRPGETWRLGPPMGRLHVNAASREDLLLVAGGTGVAPIRAALMQLAEQGANRRTTVFVGGRKREDLYDLPTLRTLSYDNPWLDIVPVLEELDDHAGADTLSTLATGAGGAEYGTLADVVTHYGAWHDHDVLVCGSPPMIRATVSRMLVAGTPLDRIRYDPFTLD
jgi:NAD(P)H-flavin reductase/hemoglobin-like flavoprotein